MSFDARWEWFPAGGEVVAASIFYKDFTDPIESVVITGAELVESYENVDSAENLGAELEFRRNLAIVSESLSQLRPDRQLHLGRLAGEDRRRGRPPAPTSSARWSASPTTCSTSSSIGRGRSPTPACACSTTSSTTRSPSPASSVCPTWSRRRALARLHLPAGPRIPRRRALAQVLAHQPARRGAQLDPGRPDLPPVPARNRHQPLDRLLVPVMRIVNFGGLKS